MKILVTGCAGFIGANYVEFLLSEYPNDTIIGVDKLTYAANLEALSRLRTESRFRFFKADICDVESINDIFTQDKPDVVVNFAAESHVDRSIQDSTDFVRTNILGVQVLLDVSLRYSVKRFHQVSTDEVYGDIPLDSNTKFTESSPLRPSSPYSATKAAADLLALSYMKTHGIPVSISRSSNNFGKYQHKEKLIPMIVNKLILNEDIPLYGDGSCIRDWIAVEDNCRAIDCIVRKGGCEIYNIGSDNHISNIDMANEVVKRFQNHNGKIIFVPERKGADKKYAVDSRKIISLGWKPQTVFGDALTQTIMWYRNNC